MRLPSRSPACTPAKTKIIARYRSYHGVDHGLYRGKLVIRAAGPWSRAAKARAFLFAPEVNCYKCPYKAHLSTMWNRLR